MNPASNFNNLITLLRCLTCRKRYSLNTLRKNNGFCGRCTNSSLRKISLQVRESVWNTYFNGLAFGQCWCCNKLITKYSFSCGHLKSRRHGGATDVVNLRPICSGCNVACGGMDLIVLKHLIDAARAEQNNVAIPLVIPVQPSTVQSNATTQSTTQSNLFSRLVTNPPITSHH